jgi:hypothetical protein
LLSQVDPLDVIAEDNARDTAERNNGGRWAPALIPGYVARDVSGGRTSPGSSTALSLSSTRFGNPGSVEYRIVDAPKQGTLSRPTNEWFDGSQVVYTPNAGYRGADSFRFEARDESQPAFPTSPAAAVATVVVGDAGDPDGPTLVQISGAPRRLGVGASAQLHAIVKSYHSPQVTWRATAGRINQSGLYRAPRRVPSSGSVRVSATAGDGTESHVTIRIVKKKRVSAPDLPTPGGRGPLSRLAVGKYGRLMVVKFVARRRGRVRVAVTHKGRKVASCTVRAPKRVAVTCRMRLPRRLATTRKGRLTVRAALEVQGRVVATRRTRVSLAATKVVSIRANSSALHVAHERHHHHD